LIEKGLDKQVILYWYQDRGRVVASEYWAKAYLIWDAITKNRTDGALVRISLPVTKSTEETYQEGLTFMRDIWPSLQEYLPDGADTLTSAL
jgi:EpsI family protein